MIKNIRSLKSYGIFRDCTNTGVNDFGKFNLIYGWNGSGKSTLSNLFQCVEKLTNVNSKRFPDAEFAITLANGQSVTQQNIQDKKLNLYTFNQQFILDNLDWNNAVKSILLIDKQKIDERKELETLKATLEKDSAIYINEEKDLGALQSANAKFLSDGAKHVKASLQIIGAQDSRYLNYDKTKLEKFILANEVDILLGEGVIELEQLVELTNAAKPLLKPELLVFYPSVSATKLVKAKTSLDQILASSVTGNFIERLTKNPDINSWVSEGLKLHEHHQSASCEFCGQVVTDTRLRALSDHFSNELKAFNDRLATADKWLLEQFVELSDLPSSDRLYDEFKEKYSTALANLNVKVDAINACLTTWHEVLKKKIVNTFDVSLTVEEIPTDVIAAYELALAELKQVIELHNDKTENFVNATTAAKHQFELHFATYEVISYDYFAKCAAVQSRKEKNSVLKSDTDKLRMKIQEVENSLSNEGIGAEKFNESLHRFIGRSELSLRFNKTILGYEILRNNSGKHDGNLSEGEKTAIAFVYFITKLGERNNEIKDTVVVVDDPVSSFDSNHLFHAYAFLRNACADASQLFVLTHNFTFFKLVRDWFEGGNKNRKRKGRDINAFFYVLQTATDSPRHSCLVNADSSLVEYNSEYHYIFSQLYRYKAKLTLSRDDAFLTANLARKLLEAFFSFKYPKHRNDISTLMDCGLEGCVVTDKQTKEKIYRFINKYSHNIGVEINEDASDNLLGEGQNVLTNIFTWMQEVDGRHFKEMEETAVT